MTSGAFGSANRLSTRFTDGTMLSTRILTALCLSLALVLSGTLLWGFHLRGKVQVQATHMESLERDLAAAEATLETIQTSARQDALQATQRDTLTKPVKQAHKAVKQGALNEVRPVASDAQLERLRALADTANGSITAASELP